MTRVASQFQAADDIQPPPGRRMTEREFVSWIDDKTRAEWADGEVIVMAADSIENSKLGLWLLALVEDFSDHHGLGEVLGPNVMVRLGRQRRRRMPDVLFVAKGREQIIKPNHIEGPPDLAIEVVAKESFTRDWREKYIDYEKAGVREYWVVDRLSRKMEAYILSHSGKYEQIKLVDGKLASIVLPGFYLKPKWLLGAKLPSRAAVGRELGL